MPRMTRPPSFHMLTAPSANAVVLPYAESPLKFFQPADWMKDLYKNQSGQPIVSVGDGGYKVTESGLYLIYSSVRVSVRFFCLTLSLSLARSYDIPGSTSNLLKGRRGMSCLS